MTIGAITKLAKYATGPLPSDVWVDSAGVVTYTPV